MARSLVLLAALTGATLAASEAATSVNVLLFQPSALPLEASVIGVDSATTTLALACAPNAPTGSCNAPKPWTVVQAHTTLAISIEAPIGDDESRMTDMSIGCELKPKDNLATCEFKGKLERPQTTENESENTTISGYSALMQPISVTAGAEKLAAVASTTPTGSSKPSSSSVTVSKTASSTVEPSRTASGRPSGTPASSTSGNAAAAVTTQNAILAGVAAVVGALIL